MLKDKFHVGQKVLYRNKIKCTVVEVKEHSLMLEDMRTRNALARVFGVDDFDGVPVEDKVTVLA